MVGHPSRLFDYGVAARSLDDAFSGDHAIVRDDGAGSVLVAVADGLGHGWEACRAASLAMQVLASPGAIRRPCELVHECHRALAETRGVVLAVAVIDAASGVMTWLAVGNVEGRLVRAGIGVAPQGLMLAAGIVGHRLPRLHPAAIALRAGDILVFATDGIDPRFDEELLPGLPPRLAAEHILARCDRGTDDALVLVGHWLGRDGRR
jgi:phosphoserine phosphatase RsbX